MKHYVDKPLHGYYEHSSKWYYWLTKGDLFIGFLVATNEQVLSIMMSHHYADFVKHLMLTTSISRNFKDQRKKW